MKKKNIGSSFDRWLREDGSYEETTATAIKRVLARQVEAAMQEQQFSKAEMRGGCARAAQPSIGCETSWRRPVRRGSTSSRCLGSLERWTPRLARLLR